MAARSRGRKEMLNLSREAAAAHSAKAKSCHRFSAHGFIMFHFLRAYARSYVRPPLRG
jgi:hypothetical protein